MHVCVCVCVCVCACTCVYVLYTCMCMHVHGICKYIRTYNTYGHAVSVGMGKCILCKCCIHMCDTRFLLDKDTISWFLCVVCTTRHPDFSMCIL